MKTTSTSVLQLGHPTLTKVAQPVDIPIEDATKALVKVLLEVLKRDNGVGIAAPQIGQSQQVIIIASRPNIRYPSAPSMQPLVMLNPKILAESTTLELGWEGCLSVPDVRGQVERFSSVEVEYFGLDNQRHQERFEGFVARIVQHEYDHLNGTLFVDRVSSSTDLMSEAEFFKKVL